MALYTSVHVSAGIPHGVRIYLPRAICAWAIRFLLVHGSPDHPSASPRSLCLRWNGVRTQIAREAARTQAERDGKRIPGVGLCLVPKAALLGVGSPMPPVSHAPRQPFSMCNAQSVNMIHTGKYAYLIRLSDCISEAFLPMMC